MGVIIAGEMSENELRKIAEAYDFMAPEGNTRKWLENYKKCKREPYDFCFMNVDSMEMRRNFDEIIWSKKDDNKEKPQQDVLEPIPEETEE
jgi:hypothetical protein